MFLTPVPVRKSFATGFHVLRFPLLILWTAVPKEWKSGSVSGIKLRGGKTISFKWKGKKIYDLTVE